MEASPDLWRYCNLAWRRCRPTDAALALAAPRWSQLQSLSLAGVAGVSDAGLQVGKLRRGLHVWVCSAPATCWPFACS